MSIRVNDINVVRISTDGVNFKEFSGVGRETIGWNEVVWGSELNRGNDFTLENIDDIDFGVVPQLTLVFKYIKIEDFLEIQSLLRQRHLIVNYFDVDLGERVTHEMAITGNERKKIYSMRNYINGVQELKIKMVATNRDDRVLQRKITYHKNFGDDINEVYEEDLFNIGEQATFRNCTLARTGYYFVKWNTKADGSGVDYIPSTSLTIYQNYSLFAIWQPTGE